MDKQDVSLIVDDEKEIADLVAVYLKGEGFAVQVCYNGNDAMDFIEQSPPQLALLDVMLPDADGFTLCRQIRDRYDFPVVMLTAKTEDMDKINGLMIGADDYITKPFTPLELIARVKAQLRRYTRYNQLDPDALLQERDTIDFNGLVMQRSTHKCYLYEKEICLTPIEFSILWILCENRGKVISSEELFEKVWGEKYLESNNTVMVHIRRIRDKMGEPARNPRFIKTVWGVGYRVDG